MTTRETTIEVEVEAVQVIPVLLLVTIVLTLFGKVVHPEGVVVALLIKEHVAEEVRPYTDIIVMVLVGRMQLMLSWVGISLVIALVWVAAVAVAAEQRVQRRMGKPTLAAVAAEEV